MGSSKRQKEQSGIYECALTLRRFLVDAAGGLSEVGRTLGVAKQQVDHWRKNGFPLQKCPEFSVILFEDARLRWALNFEAVYAYESFLSAERKGTKSPPVKNYWLSVVDASPLSTEEKQSLKHLYERRVRSR